jgi:hypothetical protein
MIYLHNYSEISYENVFVGPEVSFKEVETTFISLIKSIKVDAGGNEYTSSFWSIANSAGWRFTIYICVRVSLYSIPAIIKLLANP